MTMANFHSRLSRVSPAAILLLLMAMVIGLEAEASDSGTFFLKAAKNVPRIGRRSGDPFFLKAPKNVPRIGRRGENIENSWNADNQGPWSPSRQDMIPSRMVRINPSRLSSIWHSPSRSSNPNQMRTPSSVESDLDTSSDENRLDSVMGPRYDLLDNSQDDDSSQEIEFLTSQLVAPPRYQQLQQRLPQEGGFDPYRQQRSREGQPEK